MSKQKGIYLVARYYKKPQAHVNTSKKGWMDNPENIRWDEQMTVTRGLKPKDKDAQVILCLSDKTVTRNTFQTGKTFDEIFIYFLNGYSQYLVPVMGQIDPEYLQVLADAVKQTMEEEIPEAEVIEVPHEEVQAE